MAKLKTIWRDYNITLRSKVKLLHALIYTLTFLYVCESWTLNAETQRRIQAVETRSLRNVLGISYTDHVTNEEVWRRITQQVGYYEELLTVVKKRKLRWYMHITRSNRLFKTILQGTVQGGSRWGRQRKRWMDNIAEWTGKSFAETRAIAHNQHRWREMVQSSSVQHPYNPGGLRDQWQWQWQWQSAAAYLWFKLAPEHTFAYTND